MVTFFGGLALVAHINAGLAQVPANRPADPPPAPVTAACCGATVTPALAPPPQGTNKGLLDGPMMLTSLVDAIVSNSKNEGYESTWPYHKFSTDVQGA